MAKCWNTPVSGDFEFRRILLHGIDSTQQRTASLAFEYNCSQQHIKFGLNG